MRPETAFDAITASGSASTFHWKRSAITWAELVEMAEHPANRKGCGGYVLGTFADTTAHSHKRDDGTPCHALHRSKAGVRTRGALTLDADYAYPGWLERITPKLPGAAIIHTTWRSTPEEPRYRVIIPLDRPVTGDEYHVAASAVLQLLGEKAFDPGSIQAERFMFRPSAQSAAAYEHVVIDGDPARVDDLLKDFQPDLSELPAPSRGKTKQDPYEVPGTIGAFNRAYEDFAELIDVFDLPYEERGADRWSLVGASGAAGMGPAAPGYVYSHHANDPASGVMCSAFDLVRLHHFGELDESAKAGTPIHQLPSHKAMLDFATTDERVLRELFKEDFGELESTGEEVLAEVLEAATDWWLGLKIDSKKGTPEDTIGNWDLIRRNDRAFKALRFNELTMAIELSGDLPWRALTPGRESFDAMDRSALYLHVERSYGLRGARGYIDDLINETAMGRRFNPLQNYLEGLTWDGVERMETSLPGVRPTPFTRLAARKALVQAVARALDPGCKADQMLVLYGTEGLGKSAWVDGMAKGFSAQLGRINDKDTLLTMQRSWILTSDEGHSLRKADFDAQKEFLTRTADVFRMPYDREAQVHKRHCVIWGTTNDDVFLRRQEGNRRFLIVHCAEKMDFDAFTPEYVDQVWAEAVHAYRAGEPLFMTEEEEAMARTARETFTEEDAMGGLVREFLDRLIPANWEDMGLVERQMWLMNAESGDAYQAPGTHQVMRVSSTSLWVEALGREKGKHKIVELRELSEIMKRMPGWRKRTGVRMPGYGPQTVFERIAEEDDLLS